MSYSLPQALALRDLLFFMTDSSNRPAGKTGLSPTVVISKNGGSFNTPSGNIFQVGNGWYRVAANAADVATIGPLILTATAAGADPTNVMFEVIPANVWLALNAGTDFLPVDSFKPKFQVSGAILTVKKQDGVTTAYSKTLVTDDTAIPVVGSQ